MGFALGRRSRRIAMGAGAALALSAGIAYATGGGGSSVIYACKLKNVGTIRLIEPGKPGLQGHCSNVETAISWNQQGPAGAVGPKGDRGPAGPKGDTGAAGAPGAKGDTGPQGEPGAKGDTGAQGVPGAKGDTGAQGVPGTPGAKGDTGPQGVPGTPGAPGAKGDKGDTGAQGVPGTPGAPGAAGRDGLSGYQIVQSSIATPTGLMAFGTQFCPAGKKMISGGWKNDQGDGNPAIGAVVTSSAPTNDGSGWTGGLYNTSGATITVTVYTVCVDAPASAPAARAGQTPASSLRVVAVAK